MLETREHLFDAGAAIDRARAAGLDARLALFGAPADDLARPGPAGLRALLARERETARSRPGVVLALPRGSGLAVDGQGGFLRDADLVVVEAAVESLRLRGIDARFDRRSSLGLADRGGPLAAPRVLLDLDRVRLRRSDEAVAADATVRLTVRDPDGRDHPAVLTSLSARVDRAPFDVLAALGAKLADEVLAGRGRRETTGASAQGAEPPRDTTKDTGKETAGGARTRPKPLFFDGAAQPWTDRAGVALDAHTLTALLEQAPLAAAAPLRLVDAPSALPSTKSARWVSPSSPLGLFFAAGLAHARLGVATGPAPTLRVEASRWEVSTGSGGSTRGGSTLTSVNLLYQIDREGQPLSLGAVHAASLDPAEAMAKAVVRMLAACAHELRRHEGVGATSMVGAVPPEAGRPSVIVLERVAHTRDFLELVFVETATGALLRREVVPLGDAAHGPPGVWLLSERTVEGLSLSPAAYGRLAAALSSVIGLGPVGDGFHLGYFGRYLDDTAVPVSADSAAGTSTPPYR